MEKAIRLLQGETCGGKKTKILYTYFKMQIYYKKLMFLTWAIAFATFALRFALPHTIIFGPSEILAYSSASILGVIITIFFITNLADQNLLQTFMRFDMSVPVSTLISSDIGWVASEYPMGDTYFPNVLNPIAKLLVKIPEINPGFLVHKAVGFDPSVTSYYAVSLIGEAIMNFPDSKVMWSIIIMLQLLLYIFLAKLSWRYYWKIESIALFTISSSYLIFHGFEDYFAVRIIEFFKIFMIFYSLTLVNRMIRGTLVK